MKCYYSIIYGGFVIKITVPILIIFLTLIAVVFSGCEEQDQRIYTVDDLLGTWIDADGGKFIFYNNSTFLMMNPKGTELDGTYNFTDNILFIETFINNETIKITFLSPSKINGIALGLSIDFILIFEKQER
jgi:hypothetical protein